MAGTGSMRNVCYDLRVLLNKISDELTTENVRSLMLIYGIDGRAREKINDDGRALFTLMIKHDYIGDEPEKLRNLYDLMRRMKPQNLDLVRLVEAYINKKFDTNDVREVIGDFSESVKICKPKRHSIVSVPEEKAAFTLSCTYAKFSCRKVPSLWWPFVALFVVAIIVTSVLCFSDGRGAVEKIKSGSDLKCVFILSAEILILCTMIGVRCWRKKYCRKEGYQQFGNANARPTMQGPATGNNGASSIAMFPRPHRISEASECSVFSSHSFHKAGSSSSFGTMSEQQRGQIVDEASHQNGDN